MISFNKRALVVKQKDDFSTKERSSEKDSDLRSRPDHAAVVSLSRIKMNGKMRRP
jgi:hypothetical protein